jgi:hypothetical protein
MRTFTVRSGKFKGEHLIFNDVQEAIDNKMPTPISPWYEGDVGNWVVADDGYVLQILNRYQLKNRRHINGQHTISYRFCNGTAYVYWDKNNIPHPHNFYGAVAHTNKNSLGNTPKTGRYMNSNKKLFVSLVAEGMNPFMATIKAFPSIYGNHRSIITKVEKLLNDEQVKVALMEAMAPFIEKVESTLKEKTGYNDIVEYVTDQLVALMADSDVSIKDKRENIKLVISLFSDKFGIEPKSKAKQKEIQDAQYEVVAPPQLGKL